MVTTTHHVVGGVLLLSTEGGNVNWVDCYRGQPELQQTSSYSVDVTYHPTNGHPDNHSPNSSHLSVQSGDAATLVSRTQKQQTTQQVRMCVVVFCTDMFLLSRKVTMWPLQKLGTGFSLSA